MHHTLISSAKKQALIFPAALCLEFATTHTYSIQFGINAIAFAALANLGIDLIEHQFMATTTTQHMRNSLISIINALTIERVASKMLYSEDEMEKFINTMLLVGTIMGCHAIVSLLLSPPTPQVETSG